MPRLKNISVQSNFSKGLITEATGLTFPENACTDTDNCIFNHFGIVNRRPGFDYEARYSTLTSNIDQSVIVSYLWNNVAGVGDIVFVVVQIGDTLHFYKVSSDAALSSNKHPDTIDLTDFTPAGVVSVRNLECQFTSGNGILFVTNRRLDPFYIKYDIDADTITAIGYSLTIRDFEGDIADTNTIDQRPSSSSQAHTYNLLNQGWTTANITAWDTARTDLPSNADVAWYFKNATDEFDFTVVDDRFVGNSPAPKGHFIYDLYDQDRSTNSSGATDFEIPLERMTTCAFFAGRVFYSGLNVENINSRIWFTQIIERPDQYGKCYQTNDSTSEQLFDLLPSDGGVIDVLEAGTIFKMVNVLNSLIIFASNGVWSITGSQGIGFTANDYSVNKISTVTNISNTSFVDVEGTPYWWNLEGIYTVSLDRQTNSMRVQSVTDQTIRQFYIDLPAESKQFARGAYDPFTKKIQWIYKSRDSNSFSDKYVYDRMLTLNLLSSAYYPWSVDDTNVRVHSLVNIFGLSGVYEDTLVVDAGDQVQDSGDDVIVFQATSASTISALKYFCSFVDGSDTKLTFAECFDIRNRDWYTYDTLGTAYDSFFDTGFVVRGQAIRKFQQNYVNVYSDPDADTSFKIQGKWDFYKTGNSGRWSSMQTFDHIPTHRRVKIRGHGQACQLRIQNSLDNPFKIIGWAVLDTGNQWI